MKQFADDPALSAGHEYWSGLPRKDGVPDMCDVDVVDIPPFIIPNIALLDIIEDGADARFRLAGEEFNDNFGFSVAGKKATEVTEGDYRDYMLGHIGMLVESRRPIYSDSTFRWNRGGLWRTRRLIMPLSNGESGTVDIAMAVQTWPHELMRGEPIREVINNSVPVEQSEPAIVESPDD